MKIAEISIKRPSLVMVMFIILTLGGLLSYSFLSYELIPKFEVNVLTVQTVYPGASPSEVENTVTKDIEDAVSSLENIKKLEAKSFESLSLVMIHLNDEADADYALNDAQRKVNAILKDLPEDIDPPSLVKFSIDDMPIMTLSVTSDQSESELYDLLDKQVEPVFSRVQGVAQVDLIGGQEREIQISIDPYRLEGYGLSLMEVQQVILSSNLDFPTGNVKTRNDQTIIRLAGKFKDIEELRRLPITTADGSHIFLQDIADVQDSEKEVEKISRLDQQSTIFMQVLKQSDANAVAVSQDIQSTIESVEEAYAENGLKVHVANDTTDYTLNAANSVLFDLGLAVVLVGLIMLFFLHSLRNAAIVMTAIPLSLIGTFIGLYLLGYTLNLMSLLGLSLVVGILVDDAIVVIENIHRHMEMGKNKVRAAYDGAAEIGFTVLAITTVIIVVFFPIAMSSGLAANILTQFCMTIIVATGLSLLVSFTIVPWLFSRFGRIEVIANRGVLGRMIHGFENGLTRFTHWISDLLKWCLASRLNKVLSIAVVLVAFVGSIALVGLGYIGGEFFPGSDKGEFLVQIEMEKDASIETTNFMTQKAERYISQRDDVERLITTVGQSSQGGMASVSGSKNMSEIHVILKDNIKSNESTKVFAAKLKRELEEELVGAKVTTVPMGMMGPEQAPLKLTIIGTNLDDALDFANQAADQLREISGATNIELTTEEGNPEIEVEVDREKMAQLGINLSTVGTTMQTAFAGNTDGKFRAGEYEYDINIRFAEAGRMGIEDVRNLQFINPQGEKVLLSQFADVTYSSGPSLLERRDKSPAVSVEAQVVGRPLGSIAEEWEQEFSQIEARPGVSYVWDGDMENQSEGFGTLGIALLASIILVYLVMVALYDSFVTPFIVIFSVPLSFIGALLLMALTNTSLNIFTILGIIMLIGLVCKNAILLVDFANLRKEAGDNTHDALIAANHARLRPIMMTTVAMVIGMVPIAFGTGDGAEVNRGLAIVIIGGLLSSLFLTLIVVPVVYSIFDSIQNRFGTKEKIDFDKEINADFEMNPDYIAEYESN